MNFSWNIKLIYRDQGKIHPVYYMYWLEITYYLRVLINSTASNLCTGYQFRPVLPMNWESSFSIFSLKTQQLVIPRMPDAREFVMSFFTN